MYHFTESDLNIKSIAQLKDVYSQIGCTLEIADKRVKANWVTAILTSLSAQLEKVAVASVKLYEQAIQAPTVQSGSLTFKKALSANPNKTVYEVFRALDSLGLVIKNETGDWCSSNDSAKHQSPYEAAAALLPTNPVTVAAKTVIPEIEVDSSFDSEFGLLYRVWNSRALLGTFYRAIDDDKWVVQPYNSSDRPRVQTPGEAQLLIAALSGLLVVDTHNDDTDIDQLLDKPFDQLTPDDWKRLKQLEQLEPIAA